MANQVITRITNVGARRYYSWLLPVARYMNAGEVLDLPGIVDTEIFLAQGQTAYAVFQSDRLAGRVIVAYYFADVDTKYTNLSPTPSDLGGIPAGSTFNQQTTQQMFDKLLYPYQAPAFSAFSIVGQSSPIEVGDKIPANPSFTWGTTNPSNIVANSLSILDVTGAVTLLSGLANSPPAACVHAFWQLLAAGDWVFRIQGQNSQLAFFTRDFTVTWQWRVYLGESSLAGPLTEAQVKALRASGLQAGFAGTYAFDADSLKYKYIAYPESLGTATVFKDEATGFDVPFEAPYLVSITNTFGVVENYRVHRSTNQLGAAMNIVVS